MRRTVRISAVLVSVIAVIATVAAGCADNRQDADDRKLTWFMWSGSQTEVDTWKAITDMVTAEHPDIQVRFETTSFDDYFSKLITRAASDSLPCLISMQAPRTQDIGEVFLPLDELMAENGVDPKDFDPAVLKGLRYDGAQRALPYDLGPYIIFYNKTLFRQAGVGEPRPGWTIEEFESAARRITNHGTYGFVTDSYPDRWFGFALGMGAEYRSDGKLDLQNRELVKSFEWVADLVREDRVAAPVPATAAGTWAIDQWRSGNAAMVVNGPWDLINAKENVDFEVGIAPVPTDGREQISLTTGSGFGISRDCPNPEAAFDALNVLTGPRAAEYLASHGRAFPARTAQQDSWYDHAVPGARPALRAALDGAVPYRTTKGWDHTSALLAQYGVEAFSGAKTARDVLRTVESQAAQ